MSSEHSLSTLEPESSPSARGVLGELTRLLISGVDAPAVEAELVISLDDEGAIIRDLATYLSLVDRFYGRLSAGDLNKYSHRPDEQLRYTQIRHGSWQIVFRAGSLGDDNARLAALYLLLKYLRFVELASLHEASLHIWQATSNGVPAARENRKHLRQWMSRDELLQGMEAKRLSQLVAFLDGIYVRERSLLVAGIRFAFASVKDIKLTRTSVEARYGVDPFPLRGSVLNYVDPFEPVALEEWDALA